MTKRFKRVNYFEGQLLTAADFQQEQDYFRGKMQLQNRIYFGAGIVTGLEVVARDDGLLVKPGIAIDCLGRELVVEEDIELRCETDRDGLLVLLEHAEFPAAHTPTPTGSHPARIIEGARAYLGESDLPSTHRATPRGWQACGHCQALPIAVLRRGKPERFRADDSGSRNGPEETLPSRVTENSKLSLLAVARLPIALLALAFAASVAGREVPAIAWLSWIAIGLTALAIFVAAPLALVYNLKRTGDLSRRRLAEFQEAARSSLIGASRRE